MDRAEAEPIVVEFRGEPAGTAPLTWGQRNMRRAIAENPPAHFNLSWVTTPPDRGTLEPRQAAERVGTLVRRHESLRTVFPDDGDRQEVLGAGRLAVAQVHCDGADPGPVADQLRAKLAAPAFDDARELPLRVGLVTSGGRVQRIVLVVSHLAADGSAAEILDRELHGLAADPTGGPATGLQPRDLAAREQATGRRINEAAVAHWEQWFRRMPPAMFDDAGPAHDPPCQRMRLTSRALLPAVQLLSGAYKVSYSMVLLAATAAMIARWQGHRIVTLGTLVSNRFQPGHQNLVTTLAQLGLFGVELDGPPDLPELIPAALRATLRAYRYGYYDPDLLWSRLDQVSVERGRRVHPYCCFNDMRHSDGSAGTDHAELRAAIDASESETELDVLPSLPSMHCRFCLRVTDAPGAIAVWLTADTRYLPPAQVRRFLRETERLVLDTARQTGKE